MDSQAVTKSTLIKGNFFFAGTKGDKDYETYFEYDDNYFSSSAISYNHKMGTMSLCLAMSAFGSSEYSEGTEDERYKNKSKNVRNLFGQLGYVGFEVNECFKTKPKYDSIGVAVAHKQLDGFTVIAIAIRGGGYEKEWVSNVKVGNSERFHDGFKEARDKTLEFLKGYIKDKGIAGSVKFWVTGYSRAAATANLVLAGLNDNALADIGVVTKKENIFGYTFATPAGARGVIDQNQYNNIFNIILESDLVPKVAPGWWSYIRYGNTKRFPSIVTHTNFIKLQDEMLKYFENLGGFKKNEYILRNFAMYVVYIFPPMIIVNKFDSTPQEHFLDRFVKTIAKYEFISPNEYKNKYQDHVMKFIGILAGQENEKTVKIFNRIYELVTNNKLVIVESILSGTLLKTLANFIFQAFTENGVEITKAEIESALEKFSRIIINYVLFYIDDAATLLENLNIILQGHYPEIALAWMRSMSSLSLNEESENFVEEQMFTNGNYRVVYINAPADVQVTLGDYVVASFENEKPVPANNEQFSVSKGIDANGQKVVYLPANSEFNIFIKPTSDDDVYVSVHEFDADVGDVVRVINYRMPVSNCNAFDLAVPAWDVSTSVECTYNLADNANKNAEKSVYVGDNVKRCETMIEVEGNGLVKGKGHFIVGTFNKLSAHPYEGNRFVGWYSNGKLICEDTEYRFRVVEDTTFVARFEVIEG